MECRFAAMAFALLAVIGMGADATELLSLDWEHAVMADVGPSADRRARCDTSSARHSEEQVQEFNNGLGCGQRVTTESSVTGVVDRFRATTISDVHNRVGSTGTRVAGRVDTSFRRDTSYDSFFISNKARLSAGSFRDDGVETAADLDGITVAIVDTATDRDVENRSLELAISISSGERDDPSNLIPPLVATSRIVDQTTGELLFVRDFTSEARMRDFVTIPFNDRLGHQLRVEFTAHGAFSGIPPENDELGASSMTPSSWVNSRVSLVIPEPSSSCAAALGVLAAAAFFRRREIKVSCQTTLVRRVLRSDRHCIILHTAEDIEPTMSRCSRPAYKQHSEN